MKLTREELIKDLQIESVSAFRNELCPNGGIRIEWSGAIGFGQYDFVIGDDSKIRGYSEHMEKTEDKYFSKELLRLLHEMIVVEE